ncbi:MAG TPA: hypothetical protein ENJ32_04135 [Crenotrichaceae bacterium]|nr:hypothetical protein [Crenotrichaceae bacterium]
MSIKQLGSDIVIDVDHIDTIIVMLLISTLLLISVQPVFAEDEADSEVPDYQWQTVDVDTELEALAKQHGLVIRGIDKTSETEAVIANEPLPATLKRLLGDFNYMEIRDDDGNLQQINIIGLKGAPPEHSSTTVISTEQEGGHHKIKVGLTGTDGVRHDVLLLVDTGADVVVLEEAMIDVLQLDRKTLTRQVVKTANGETEALKGKIPVVQIKSEKVEMVEAAFMDRKKLGGQQLLGMSLLGKFKITLDDLNGEMTLVPNSEVP